MKSKLFQSFYPAILLLLLALACSKKNEDNGCRTCKATGRDQPTIEKQVCTDAQEKDFREDNPGALITCN